MLDDLFMNFLNDKESAVRSIFDDIENCDKYSKGLEKFLSNIDDTELTEENIRKKFKTLMKVLNTQNTIVRKLLYITLIYMSGDNFDTDVGKLLIRMGRGEEALQTMFKNKLKGKM